MAKSLLLSGGSPQSQNSNLTRYVPVAASMALDITTEAPAQSTWRTASTLSGLYVKVTAYSLNSGNLTIRTRKNLANGNQSISATGTGEFEDLTNTDSVAAGDEINFSSVTGGTSGSVSVACVSVLCTASTETDTVSRLMYKLSVTLSRNTTYYRSLQGDAVAGTTTTEAHAQCRIGTAGTVKNLCVHVGSNNISNNSTVTLRKGAADTALTVSITASTTGFFEDTSNSVSVADGDLLNYSIVTGVGSGSQSINLNGMAVDLVTTNNKFLMVSGRMNGASNSVTSHYAISGAILGGTTESDYRFECNRDLTFSKAFCYVSANATTVSSTLKIRDDGVDTAVSISITNGGTGLFEDASNSATVLASHEVNWRLVPGSSNSITFRVMGVTVEDASEKTLTLAADMVLSSGGVTTSTITLEVDMKAVARLTLGLDADTKVVARPSLTLEADITVVVRSSITLEADVQLVARPTVELVADTRIASRLTLALDADVILFGPVLITLAADVLIASRLTVTLDADVTTVVRLSVTTAVDVLLVARLTVPVLVDTVVVARLLVQLVGDTIVVARSVIPVDVDLRVVLRGLVTMAADMILGEPAAPPVGPRSASLIGPTFDMLHTTSITATLIGEP